jgi:hypothetical protein
LPCLPGSLTLRVWLPSRCPPSYNPWKPLSAPHTLGLPPSELSSSTVIEKAFPPLLSALALFTETFPASIRRSDGFLPRWKPCPSSLPEGLVPVRALALLGLRTSQALSPSTGLVRSLSPQVTLSVLSPLTPCGMGSTHLQGPTHGRPGLSPLRAPACLAFSPLATRVLFEEIAPRGLFFPLGNPQDLTAPEHPLFAGDLPSPIGRT